MTSSHTIQFPRLILTIVFFSLILLLSRLCLGARSIEFTQRVAEGYR